LTIHHINEDRSDNAYDNQIVLCSQCHDNYHNKNITKDEIVRIKRLLIYKTLSQYGVNAIKIASKKTEGVAGMDFMLNHLIEMGYITKGGYLFRGGPGDKTDILSLYNITEKGRSLYKRWLKQSRIKPRKGNSSEQEKKGEI